MRHYTILLLFIGLGMIYSKSIIFKIENNKENIISDNIHINRELNNSIKAILYSSIIPGSGQYLINKNKFKGIMMLGLEVAALSGYSYNKSKAEKYKDDYQAYGDNHWDFAQWCSNYYHWNDNNNEFFEIFSNSETGIYPEIFDDSHHIDFWYTNNGVSTFISTSSTTFQDIYNNQGFSNLVNIQEFIEANNVTIEKDHHFYENIVKYNHFYAGWDDSIDNIELSTTSNGYQTAVSTNKLNYRAFYDKSIERYQYSGVFLNVILFNHFVSMLDALIVSKVLNNNLSLSFDYNSRINFYEANLSLNLR